MNLISALKFGVHKVRQYGFVHCLKRFLSKQKESTAIPLYQLTIESENAVYGVQYKPSPDDVVASSISELSINYAEFSFIDVGSGEGRTLLVAERFGFKRVIGVEFAKELVEISRKNCPNAETYCQDATTYDLPDGNLVIYMYNPFEAPVMEKVMVRISEAAKTRLIYLIYLQAECADVVLKYASPIVPDGWIRSFIVNKHHEIV